MMKSFLGHFLFLESCFPSTKGIDILQSQPPCNGQDLFFVHCADCALEMSSLMLDEESLFCSSSNSAWTGYDEELDEVFGETKDSNYDER